jgi:hypothetical protein
MVPKDEQRQEAGDLARSHYATELGDSLVANT